MNDTALGTDPAVADIHKVSPYTQMISILYLAHPTEHPIYLYMKKGGRTAIAANISSSFSAFSTIEPLR